MRVAFHAPLKPPSHPTPSGDRAMARSLMRAVILAGHEVSLASRFRTWDGDGDEDRQRRIHDLGRRISAHLIRRYEARRPDVRPEIWLTYHVYHKAPDWLGPAVTTKLRIPYVIVEPSLSTRQADGPWRIGYDATLRALARADAVLTMSQKDYAGLKSVVTRPGCLSMFPPFIETAPFTTAREARQSHRKHLAQRWSVDVDVPWLVTAAMMRFGDKVQSYQALARSLAMLRDLDWVLLVAGDGPARADVSRFFAGVDHRRVRFLGALGPDELPHLYAAGDLYLWPAVHEAYGVAFLEAQAAGCPVVAGRYGGVPDIVADSTTGLITAAGDDQAFAEAVRRLLASPDRRGSMGEAAMRHMREHHDLGTASRRLDRVLRQALDR